MICFFFFNWYGDHRDLHVLTPSFPTRRSSDLGGGDSLEGAHQWGDAMAWWSGHQYRHAAIEIEGKYRVFRENDQRDFTSSYLVVRPVRTCVAALLLAVVAAGFRRLRERANRAGDSETGRTSWWERGFKRVQ